MNHIKNRAENVKIAYIGGGSRGWAWGLMSDLVACEDMSGEVALYDIDYEAAYHNEIIGNKYNFAEGAKTHWDYRAVKTLGEALTGADFVVISILPGTFDEMDVDVHTPEKYGIYQSVGDSSGPGGIIRALRTVPMFEEIAEAIKKYSPNAWVINYTNPMTLCVKTLYRVFPEIKAFGCCHEVFGTQNFMCQVLKDVCDIEVNDRKEIKSNVIGVNHFTWLTKARYHNVDIFDVYAKYIEKHRETGAKEQADKNWMNNAFTCHESVKMDLFARYGYIAAAGDRHLSEFCEGTWYLRSPECVADWRFALTPVSWRKEDLQRRLNESKQMIAGEKKIEIVNTGEEGVEQMRALLGLTDLVTNVNIPNKGQVPNLPYGAVVETNAVFRSDSLEPVLAGNVPDTIYPLIARICGEQEIVSRACEKRDLELAYVAFCNDPLVTIPHTEARKLFKEMLEGTSEYLTMYDVSSF